MKTRKQVCLTGLVFLMLVCVGLESSQARMDWDVYFSGRRPTRREPPPTKPPWDKVGPGTFDVRLVSGQEFYLGCENIYNGTQSKVLTIIINSEARRSLKVDEAVGHYGKGGKGKARGNKVYPEKEEKEQYPNSLIVKFKFTPQPVWEWIKFRNKGKTGMYSFIIKKAYSDCTERYLKYGMPDTFHGEGSFGVPGSMVGEAAITELWMFPESAAVDTLVVPFFVAAPGSGNWTHDFVYVDPYGVPQPQGGVQFSSDGTGLKAGDEYVLEFKMMEEGELEYSLFAFDAEDAEYYHFPADIMPVIRQWRTVRDHFGVGPLALHLDPGAYGNDEEGPAVETRLGGIQMIEVEFDRPVTLAEPTAISVTDGIDNYVPDATSLVSDNLLQMTFAGGLPEQKCYTIGLDGAIQDLSGDFDCMIRSLVGDVNGDGIVNEDDTMLLQQLYGQPVDPNNAQCDLNLDGFINPNDLIILLDNYECMVFCEEKPSEFLLGDISGPDGHPNYRVDTYDFAQLAGNWLKCNDPEDETCFQD